MSESNCKSYMSNYDFPSGERKIYHEAPRLKVKLDCYSNIKGVIMLSVSLGILKPLEGDVAKQFLMDSKKNTLDKETIKRCEELSKLIVKKY